MSIMHSWLALINDMHLIFIILNFLKENPRTLSDLIIAKIKIDDTPINSTTIDRYLLFLINSE